MYAADWSLLSDVSMRFNLLFLMRYRHTKFLRSLCA